jgi:hypothetical protein
MPVDPPPQQRSRARRVTSSTAPSASSTARPTRSSPRTPQTLKAALDGRDALVAGILALTDHSRYGFALGTIARDAASEAQDIAETLTDDTLTDAARRR